MLATRGSEDGTSLAAQLATLLSVPGLYPVRGLCQFFSRHSEVTGLHATVLTNRRSSRLIPHRFCNRSPEQGACYLAVVTFGHPGPWKLRLGKGPGRVAQRLPNTHPEFRAVSVQGMLRCRRHRWTRRHSADWRLPSAGAQDRWKGPLTGAGFYLGSGEWAHILRPVRLMKTLG